jgi:hypothetical protein
MRVAVGGLPYFGRMLATLLSGPGRDFQYVETTGKNPGGWVRTMTALARADAVYLIGGQIERWSRPDWLALLLRRPMIMHWVGSDVTYALAAARRGRTSPRLIGRPAHWAEVDWTAAELRLLGVRAEIVPLTSARLRASDTPLPDSFTVLTYLPPARAEFYGRSRVYRIAARLPDVRFLVAGNSGPDLGAPANVEFTGWVEAMEKLYPRCTVLLRLTEHDGLSFMVLEALAAGRHVIWNHPLDGVITAQGEDAALDALENLRSDHLAGRLKLNLAGQSTVLTRYGPAVVRDALLRRFAALLNAAP